MPQSEAAALANHTVLAPNPDCVVLPAVQGAGLKLAPTMYKLWKTADSRGFRSSGIWCCIITGVVPHALKACGVFMCRVMQFKKTACRWRWSILRSFEMLATTQQKTRVSHQRRLESSTKQLWKYQILHGIHSLVHWSMWNLWHY
jgi:hypothetical protein